MLMSRVFSPVPSSHQCQCQRQHHQPHSHLQGLPALPHKVLQGQPNTHYHNQSLRVLDTPINELLCPSNLNWTTEVHVNTFAVIVMGYHYVPVYSIYALNGFTYKMDKKLYNYTNIHLSVVQNAGLQPDCCLWTGSRDDKTMSSSEYSSFKLWTYSVLSFEMDPPQQQQQQHRNPDLHRLVFSLRLISQVWLALLQPCAELLIWQWLFDDGLFHSPLKVLKPQLS